MKIALVFDGLSVGGIERVGLSYTSIFLKKGHSVDIYNLNPALSDTESSFPKNCSINHFSIPTFTLPERYYYCTKKWRWGKYAYPLFFLSSLLATHINKSFFKSRESYDIAIAFSGHFRDLSFVSRNYLKAKHKLCWLHGSITEYMLASYSYGDLYRKIKNLNVLSTASQDIVLRECAYLKNDLNINHIYNPISLKKEPLNPTKVKQLKEKYGEYLLMVGRFDEDKDQKTVIKARKIIEEKYGLTPNLVFVGDGKTLDNCKQYARKIGLKESVFFEGSTFETQDYYSSAKIFVHSSPAEGLPTVLLEAMKYSLPIVATNSQPGVPEVLMGNRCGLVCKVGDPYDMAEKIFNMLTNESTRLHFIEQGNKRISDFSYEVIGDKIETILSNLI